jgi:polar amino acid transport system substrate-binding protein
VNLVQRHKADAVVGVYCDAIRGTLVSKYPFDKDYILVLFKKNKLRQWNGQETFKNKKVAWIKGYAFNENLEVPFIKREFEKREDILRLLDRDQVDFFMDTRNDLEAVLNKGIIDVTHYTVESVMELDRFLAFADNQKGRKLKKIFDDRFPLLVKSGKLEQLHAKWNW